MADIIKVNTESNGIKIVSPTNQLDIVKQWNAQLGELVEAQQDELTPEEKTFGVSILTNLAYRCIKDKIDISELRMTNFLEQVKHYAKLKLSIAEGEIYLDIRNIYETQTVTKTSAKGVEYQAEQKVPVGKEVTISRQYQGMQKLLMTYCSKQIVRFKDGIVFAGDEFEEYDDFDTGITRIKHKKNLAANRTQYAAIEYAYAIAYVDEHNDGNLVPYTCVVPKRRIDRAKKASKTDNVWNSDMERMVTKTAYWCLWGMLKPYIQFPSAIADSFAVTNDEMEWDVPLHQSDETNSEAYSLETVIDDTVEAEIAPVQEVLPPVDKKPVQTENTAQNANSAASQYKRIPYPIYTENKDKYIMRQGSWDATTKTVLVKER